jgi:hypothetical protein
LTLPRGGTARVCFTLRNGGGAALEGLRVSFQPRLDFAVREESQACYTVRAPEAINLTSQYNRVAYAQWSASFRRAGVPAVAHGFVTLKLRE